MPESHPTDPTPPSEEPTLVSLSGSGADLSAEQELPAGTKLGKYQVRGLIGRGGMGLVYEAVDTLLRREVALKILPTALTQDPQALKRFVREAQLAARLNHPNAVTVFDIARKKGLYFIAMELVRGKSADELVRAEGALGYERATRLVADACRALAAAHGAGLIHRDIKPSNILVGDDGKTKLSDFGLAKLHEAGPSNVTLTQKDVVIGTPKYMSPEQCQNEPLDARTDLYSLGATYYALLTGNAPYDTGTTMQILFAHCSQPVPDPSTSVSGLPAGCVRIIQKSMAKDRSHRYASADAMLADLERVLSHTPVATPIEAFETEPVQEAEEPEDALSALAAASAGAGEIEPVEMDFPVAKMVSRRRKSALPMPLLIGGIGGGLAVGLIVLLVVVLGGGDDDGEGAQKQAGLAVNTRPPAAGSAAGFNDTVKPPALQTNHSTPQPIDQPPTTDPTEEPRQPDPASILGVLTDNPQPTPQPQQPTPVPAEQTQPRPELPPRIEPQPPAPDSPEAEALRQQLQEYRQRFTKLKQDFADSVRNRDPRAGRQAVQEIEQIAHGLGQSQVPAFAELGEEIKAFLDEVRERLEEERQNPPAGNRPGQRPSR